MSFRSFAWEHNDWVIHEQYGIGRYIGLDSVSAGDTQYECVGIKYDDGRVVWTPATLIERIGYYAHNSKIFKNGHKASRKIEQVKAEAQKWLELFVQQESFRRSHSVAPMTPIKPEYPHASLTPDQIACIADIDRDLSSGQLMDRLVCGDVCTGKTEIALHAARTALENGYQVVLMCPTTILACQHFELFRERLPGYTAECCSKGSGNVAQTIERCTSGQTSLLVSTHSVVRNTKWRWAKLGLTIIDEEHCFGTTDKERAKFANAHCLQMSATPLPRTAHMALNKARDVSVLEAMPLGREIARTYVQSSIDIASLVDPNGQVLCVCRKISDIQHIEHQILSQTQRAGLAVPVFIVHGRMQPRKIESTLHQALRTPGAILISTAIVGVGLDKPSVRTLVVFDAHNWGLSQLHQLRGRVSRGSARGAAYFISTVKPHPTRLSLLATHDTAGCGWILAQKDLEMRGSGHIVGSKQSGHIADIGFDMFNSILKQTQGHALIFDVPKLRMIIPETYMPNPQDRLHWYRRLSQLEHLTDLQLAKEKLIARYGGFNEQMVHLWEFYETKLRAQLAGVRHIYGNDPIVIKTTSGEQYELRSIRTLAELSHAIDAALAQQ